MMGRLISLRDRLVRAALKREAATVPLLPPPLPPAARMPTARPFDPEWDDPRKAAKHAPDRN